MVRSHSRIGGVWEATAVDVVGSPVDVGIAVEVVGVVGVPVDVSGVDVSGASVVCGGGGG